MASGKAFFRELIGKFILTDTTITNVRDLAPRFREIELSGEALKRAKWSPGDKVQVFVPEAEMRTYTPFAWDGARGTTRLVAYLHGRSPGSDWAREAKVGDACRFFGPRGSLALDGNGAPVVLFGDETSFAVARTMEGAGAPTCVFEVDDAGASETALGAIGVEKRTVIARSDDGSHFDAVVEALSTAMGAQSGARLVMSGKAQSIQEVKRRLRVRGITAAQTKAYWSVGKAGLD